MDDKSLNFIPVGRQLPRTPPSKSPSSSHHQEPTVKEENHAETHNSDTSRRYEVLQSPTVKEERASSHNATPASAMGDAGLDAFIRGMQGYQWTDADLEFVYEAQKRKQFQQLQQELADAEKVLKMETLKLELAQATRDKLKAELSKTLSCEVLMELCRDILSQCQPSVLLEDLEDKVLLLKVRMGDVQSTIHEESAEVTRLEKKLTRAQERRDQEEQAMKEMEKQQKKIETAKEASQAAGPKGRARKAPKTVQTRTTPNAPKASKGKNAKGKMPEETNSSKTLTEDQTAGPPELQPTETEGVPNAARASKRDQRAPKITKPSAAKEEKVSVKKSLKDRSTAKTQTHKMKQMNDQPADMQEPLKAAQRSRNSLEASKPTESMDSETGTLRRSKRIAAKNQGQREMNSRKPAPTRGR